MSEKKISSQGSVSVLAVIVQPHVVHYSVCKAVGGTHFERDVISGHQVHQGHPTNKGGKNLFKDISRLLVIYKDRLKRCFYHLEEFDLFRI